MDDDDKEPGFTSGLPNKQEPSSRTRAPHTREHPAIATSSRSDCQAIDALGSDVYAGAVLECRMDVGGERGRGDTRHPV